MKYYVRTTGERTLHKSFNQIEYELIVDKDKKIREIFGQQLLQINDDCVLLEDDIILCRNFKQRIEQVISKFKDQIINFFTYPTFYFTSSFADNFYYNQCTYFPKEIIRMLAEEINKRELDGLRETPEKAIQAVLLEKKIQHYRYRPCLVQHIDLDSVIGHEREVKFLLRRSPYFIDYLDDLNIPYDQAGTEDNWIMLFNYMRNHIKQLKEEYQK